VLYVPRQLDKVEPFTLDLDRDAAAQSAGVRRLVVAPAPGHAVVGAQAVGARRRVVHAQGDGDRAIAGVAGEEQQPVVPPQAERDGLVLVPADLDALRDVLLVERGGRRRVERVGGVQALLG